MKSYSIKIGKRIKFAREKMEITQEQLSNLVGLSKNYISAIERGVKTPQLKTLIDIINILHLSPDILFQDVIEFDIDYSYDREFSSIVKPLPKGDKVMILSVVRVMSEELHNRNIMEE